MRRSIESGSPPTNINIARISQTFSRTNSLLPVDELSPSHNGQSRHQSLVGEWLDSAIAEPLLDLEEAGPVADDDSMWSEVGRLAALAAPLVLQNLFGYSLAVVSAVFVGHLEDPVALSSVVLAGSFYNVTGFSIIVGLAAGMETLCGQAFGAKNYLMLGVVLQRALLICWVACIPITVLWQFTSDLLTFFDQEPAIVYGASRYLALITPTLYFSVLSSTLYRYLLAQRSVLPPVVCTMVTACMCPVFNWYFIYKLQLRLDGAAYAFLLSNVSYAVLLALFVAAREVSLLKSPQRSWPGFTRRAFTGWGIYLSYGAPAAVMICMEWWMFEVVIFMAGSLPDIADIAVGVMGITFHITSFCYMIPMSVGTATSTRIANELGAGNAAAARRAFQTAFISMASVQVCIASVLYLLRDRLVLLFTKSPEVDSMVSRVMPIIALAVMGDGVNAVLSATLRAAGRQAVGAALNVVGYWCVGCPVAIVLGFMYDLNVMGFWIGLASATSIQVVVLLVWIVRIDWDNEVSRATALMHLHRQHSNNSSVLPIQDHIHSRATSAVLDGSGFLTTNGNAGSGGHLTVSALPEPPSVQRYHRSSAPAPTAAVTAAAGVVDALGHGAAAAGALPPAVTNGAMGYPSAFGAASSAHLQQHSREDVVSASQLFDQQQQQQQLSPGGSTDSDSSGFLAVPAGGLERRTSPESAGGSGNMSGHHKAPRPSSLLHQQLQQQQHNPHTNASLGHKG